MDMPKVNGILETALLGIKTVESRRHHWMGQAKLQGITISEVMVEALVGKFSEPD